MGDGGLAAGRPSEGEGAVEDVLDATLERGVYGGAVALWEEETRSVWFSCKSVQYIATYLCPVMVFHRSIRNQEQRLDAIESSLERSAIVVVGFPDRSTKSFLVCELLWRASNEDEVFRGQAAQNVLDSSAANATRSREDSDCVLRHGVVQLPGDRCFAVTEIEEIRVLYIGRAREANILYLTESGSINLQASGPCLGGGAVQGHVSIISEIFPLSMLSNQR